MKILFCSSFVKQLNNLKSIDTIELKKLLRRYPNTNDILSINEIEGVEILKCYLFQKKVRTIIFLKHSDDVFIHVSIVKKETRKGKNITKDNYEDLFSGEILRIEEDLKTKNFLVEEI